MVKIGDIILIILIIATVLLIIKTIRCWIKKGLYDALMYALALFIIAEIIPAAIAIFKIIGI